MRAYRTAAIRQRARRIQLVALGALALTFAMAPAAQAERALLPPLNLQTKEVPAGGQIEGACGVAVISGNIYVSDYYHHAVDVFSLGSGNYQTRILGNPLNGPCELATAPSGALYANDWHEGVSRLLPSALSFDSAESTGVAVDQVSGNVYVNDRQYVAVYEPSGAKVLDGEGEPLRIGVGTLGDAFGLAVFAGRVYVADAADNTVKVYEPATDPDNPSGAIDDAALPGGGFNSLVDAALAVDPSNEHLLVVDNLQPGFEHPEAVIYEFGAAGQFLGGLSKRIIDGEPAGLAFGAGILYATTGNDEDSNVIAFGPYTAGGGLQATPPAALTASPGAAAEAPKTTAESPAAAEPELRLVSSRSGTAASSATIRAAVSSPGLISASGAGIRSLPARHVAAGARVLRLHLDAAGRRALARSKLHRLAVAVRIAFAPDGGDPVEVRRTVSFKRESRGNR